MHEVAEVCLKYGVYKNSSQNEFEANKTLKVQKTQSTSNENPKRAKGFKKTNQPLDLIYTNQLPMHITFLK